MESNISFGADSLVEKLEQLELEVISCSSNVLNDLVVRKCVELVGISQLMSSTCSCLRPLYTSCLAFSYLQFKGAGGCQEDFIFIVIIKNSKNVTPG
ncbi:hypothetical protein AHF37_03015 [Paragonimus kellicotti]|nr:hypothetical protein AHF37_03015 [Paragonimus kellicotti]